MFLIWKMRRNASRDLLLLFSGGFFDFWDSVKRFQTGFMALLGAFSAQKIHLKTGGLPYNQLIACDLYRIYPINTPR